MNPGWRIIEENVLKPLQEKSMVTYTKSTSTDSGVFIIRHPKKTDLKIILGVTGESPIQVNNGAYYSITQELIQITQQIIYTTITADVHNSRNDIDGIPLDLRQTLRKLAKSKNYLFINLLFYGNSKGVKIVLSANIVEIPNFRQFGTQIKNTIPEKVIANLQYTSKVCVEISAYTQGEDTRIMFITQHKKGRSASEYYLMLQTIFSFISDILLNIKYEWYSRFRMFTKEIAKIVSYNMGVGLKILNNSPRTSILLITAPTQSKAQVSISTPEETAIENGAVKNEGDIYSIFMKTYFKLG